MIEINQDFADGVLHLRNPATNKNDYGRILCVCGSAGYTGAAYFSAQGAVRMGSGVVTLVSSAGCGAVGVKLNEPVAARLQDENGLFSRDALPKLLALAEKADALLIGCGLGRSDTLTEIVCTLLEKAACQIVLDADGINSITGHKDILRRTAKPVVLTPHAGEFARLSGKPDATAADAAQFAQDYRCIVLYKGHRTRIFTPDGGCYRNTSGNPGMAKGGSGDVLAGMLVSLCGQGIDAVPAACTAAWLHGRAGDLAANALSEYGMTPSDMLTQLPILLKRYNSKTW
ncbi:MAG: NAD(P)H-hydrate dehydratase [Butyricicoccus sp.]